jgi:DNA-binding PadR family transcriptional regulator
MKQHWYFILLALGRSDLHGSGIMRDVLALTEGELKLWPATLYGSLDELREHGWIEEVEDPSERPEGESQRKRFYRITPPGRKAAAVETGRLERLLEVAKTRVSMKGRPAR